MRLKQLLPALMTASAIAALAATAIATRNARYLRSTRPNLAFAPDDSASASVLVPVRNEQHNIIDCLSRIAKNDVAEILVWDDSSEDNTLAMASEYAKQDTRITVIDGAQAAPLPHAGWLGKTWACAQLAQRASGDYLVFIDADVRVQPHAIDASVAYAAKDEIAMLSPYPQQLAMTPLAQLTQPLLRWSWMSLIPLEIANRNFRQSMAVANGQFLVVNSGAYRAAGGHASVALDVVEDVALARQFRSHDLHTVVTDGSHLATCTMYRTSRDVFDGYTKSLAVAFGSPTRLVGIGAALAATYVVPVIAMFRTSGLTRALATVSYGLCIANRIATSDGGTNKFPLALTHPLSVIAFDSLAIASIIRSRRGTRQWKGRTLPDTTVQHS